MIDSTGLISFNVGIDVIALGGIIIGQWIRLEHRLTKIETTCQIKHRHEKKEVKT